MVGRRTVIIGPCGSSGGGGLATNNCCNTIYLAGSVDLDGLEWATDYTITLASPIGTVTVTDQGSGTWESDVVEVTCTVDEVTVTDEYTVTMTATGNAPGEVIVTVALTSGGGYGGAAGCCDTTEGGFAWKYVNCCIVDPLAGWSMTRDPSGFSGRECEIGGCEICVTPKFNTIMDSCAGGVAFPEFWRVETTEQIPPTYVPGDCDYIGNANIVTKYACDCFWLTYNESGSPLSTEAIPGSPLITCHETADYTVTCDVQNALVRALFGYVPANDWYKLTLSATINNRYSRSIIKTFATVEECQAYIDTGSFVLGDPSVDLITITVSAIA